MCRTFDVNFSCLSLVQYHSATHTRGLEFIEYMSVAVALDRHVVSGLSLHHRSATGVLSGHLFGWLLFIVLSRFIVLSNKPLKVLRPSRDTRSSNMRIRGVMEQ